MEVKELVSAGMGMLNTMDCPFCQEDKTSKKETIYLEEDTSEDVGDPNIADDGAYRLRNDSGKLAKALGDQPPWLLRMKLVSKNERIFIDAKYFKGRPFDKKTKAYYLESSPCANAHHIIPGNDSLGRAKELLRWMADTIKWKRVRYKEIPDSLSPSIKKALRKGRTVTTVNRDKEGDIDIIQRVETSAGRMKEEPTKVIKGRVTGKIEYDVNYNANGIWLPGNNAVVKWGKTDSILQENYVKAAIEATQKGGSYRQFHDAHRDYSRKVRAALNDIAKEIEKIANDCMEDETHNSGDSEPLPAPTQLVRSLNAVSRKLRKPLSGSPSSWKEPWLTSQRSLLAK